jgi:hypothetical protein
VLGAQLEKHINSAKGEGGFGKHCSLRSQVVESDLPFRRQPTSVSHVSPVANEHFALRELDPCTVDLKTGLPSNACRKILETKSGDIVARA